MIRVQKTKKWCFKWVATDIQTEMSLKGYTFGYKCLNYYMCVCIYIYQSKRVRGFIFCL